MKKVGISIVILIIVLGTVIYLIAKPQPDIQVQDINVPEEVPAGESVNVEIIVKNLGGGRGSQEVPLKVDGREIDLIDVSLEVNESQTLSFQFVEDDLGNYKLSSGKVSRTVEVLPPAEFEISDLEISPEKAETGEKVAVLVDIKNVGEVKGTKTLELFVNGDLEEVREVTLDSGSETTETYNLVKGVPGSYSIDIGGLSGNFNVLDWKKVTEFGGRHITFDGVEETDSFKIKGEEWQINWRVEGDDPMGDYTAFFDFSIYYDDEEIKGEIISFPEEGGVKEGTLKLEKRGEFKILHLGQFVDWNLEIEEYVYK